MDNLYYHISQVSLRIVSGAQPDLHMVRGQEGLFRAQLPSHTHALVLWTSAS